MNIVIAKIVAAHGIKGLVKIVSFAQDPADFYQYCPNIFDAKNQPVNIKIISPVQGSNNIFLAEVFGVNNRNQAEELKNSELFIKRSNLKEILEQDSFYYADLIGLKVLNLQKQQIGQVIAVNDFGAGGLIEIEFNQTQNIESFAFTHHIFPEINLREGFLLFNPPEIVEVKE